MFPNNDATFRPYIMILVVIFIFIQQLRDRKIKISRIWFLPIIMFVLIISNMNFNEWLSVTNSLIFISGFALGVSIGFLRVKIHKLEVDKANGEILLKKSPVGGLFFLCLFSTNSFLRSYMRSHHVASVAVITNFFLMFILGVILTRRFYLIWTFYMHPENISNQVIEEIQK